MTSDLFGAPSHAVVPPDGEKGRTERGAFYTPDALALALCRSLKDNLRFNPCSILEPGCGGGAFLRAARATWPAAELHGVDLVPACTGPGLVEQCDLFTVTRSVDLVLGNPDFGIAERVVRHGLSIVPPRGAVAFLLRTAFLGSEGRIALYADRPLYALQPIAQRPSFTADGKTDPMEYALFVWRRDLGGYGMLLPPLVWR